MPYFTEKELTDIHNHAILESGKGSSIEISDFFENKLGVVLPESYKHFLIEFGFLYLPEYEAFEGSRVSTVEERKNKPSTWDALNILKDVKDTFNISKNDNKVIPVYGIGNGDYLALNLHKYNPETKEAPIWYLSHEDMFDEDFEEITNPDYSLNVEDYDKLNQEFWRPTKYNSFKDLIMDALEGKMDIGTF